jgi:ATP/maltotriose-dependent transcriptional regulator MalT
MTQEFEAAATAFEEAEVALRIADEQDLPTIVTRANLLQFRGHSARLHGDHDKASRAYELLCALCRSLGNTHLEILTTIALSKCAVECGDIDRAISLIVRALPSAEPRSRPELQATLLAYLSALLAQRSVVEAQEMATRVLRLVADKPAQIPIAIVAIETVALTLVLSDSPHHSAARLAGFCDAYIRGIAATREDIEDINYRSLHDRLREIFTSSELGLLFAMGANLTPSEAIMEAIGN